VNTRTASIVPKNSDLKDAQILLGLLESVERGGVQSQRRLASELGIALGLVNAYLKRCVRKGLVKVRNAPRQRYAYYLTPRGFAEKSRLTVEFISYSFGFFRQAKSDCAMLFETARDRKLLRIALAGVSDLAEIAAICAVERSIKIPVVVDCQSTGLSFIGIPVVSSFEELEKDVDGVLVTDLKSTSETIAAALTHFGADRVLVPSLLRPHQKRKTRQ
jgi:DNA-binding MarR family transcriptional regulator